MTGELRITATRPCGERVVAALPITNPAEEAEARRWLADTHDRWSSLGAGSLRREIVPAGDAA